MSRKKVSSQFFLPVFCNYKITCTRSSWTHRAMLERMKVQKLRWVLIPCLRILESRHKWSSLTSSNFWIFFEKKAPFQYSLTSSNFLTFLKKKQATFKYTATKSRLHIAVVYDQLIMSESKLQRLVGKCNERISLSITVRSYFL